MANKKKFLLKDYLFNQSKVEYLAGLIKVAHADFDDKNFIEDVVKKFPKLELKERIVWIRENLKKYLPDNYRSAVEILLKSLPEESDPSKNDDDFGDFIFAPINDFVAAYGCNKKELLFSLKALKEITKRFSAEDAIRYFIVAFPGRTIKEIEKWSRDNNYHVRRLASEGTRPSLPWSQKLELPSEEVIEKILDNLYYDRTRYVVRSVANHINDISKSDSRLVVATLKKWKESGKQETKEMEYLINHALRTLIKVGDKKALKFLGYNSSPAIKVGKFSIGKKKVHIGEFVEFDLKIIAKKNEKLIIDYIVYFQNKNGKRGSKVFKIKKVLLRKGGDLTIHKKHFLRVMTTRRLYPGRHKIELQINGKIYGEKEFLLVP